MKITMPQNNVSRLHEHGGVSVRIILAAVTLVVVGVAIVLILKFLQQEHQIQLSKALVISEYGLQQAMEKLHTQPGWREGFASIPYSKGTFSVVLNPVTVGDTLFLHVVSTGRSGASARTKSARLALLVNELDSVWVPVDFE